MGTLSHCRPLAMEVLPILDVVYLRDKLLLDRFTRMQVVERLANHQFEVIIGFLNLTNVDGLELDRAEKRVRI